MLRIKSIVWIAYIFIFTGMSIDMMRYYVGIPYNTIIITEEENNSSEDTTKDVKIYRISCAMSFDFDNLLSKDDTACRNYRQDCCFYAADVLHEKENPPEV